MKATLIEKIRQILRNRLQVLAQAAQDAHAAATDPDSKAEGKYDTRSLEASYLASGQARQVEELAGALRAFDAMQARTFGVEDSVEAGALVEVDFQGDAEWFLLAPAAGGLEVEYEGMNVTLLGPESPLYRTLLGLKMGDTADSPELMVLEVQ